LNGSAELVDADFVVEADVGVANLALAGDAGRAARSLVVLPGPEILGLVGEEVVPDAVVAQPHLRDGARGVLKERGIGQWVPVGFIERMGTENAWVNPAEEAAETAVAVAAAVARLAAGIAIAATAAATAAAARPEVWPVGTQQTARTGGAAGLDHAPFR